MKSSSSVSSVSMSSLSHIQITCIQHIQVRHMYTYIIHSSSSSVSNLPMSSLSVPCSHQNMLCNLKKTPYHTYITYIHTYILQIENKRTNSSQLVVHPTTGHNGVLRSQACLFPAPIEVLNSSNPKSTVTHTYIQTHIHTCIHTYTLTNFNRLQIRHY